MRDDAIASLRLKHVDLHAGTVFQDARDVRTKARKTIYTAFFPVDPTFKTIVVHRPETTPQMFAGDSRLPGQDVLPGFDVIASDIFK
ncbi:MAG: hypothetical protein H7Z17_19830 [Fuerstia sp.]|nr:hypothetical protein [Fuerstiella sp.]